MGCYNKIEINASPSAVWDRVSNFHDLSWAPEVVTSVEAVGDKKGNEVGAKRILNGAIHETLIEHDADNLTFTYSIDDGPGPIAKDAVSDYIGVVKVCAAGNGTLVEWSSTFNSDNEDDVVEFCDPIYQALLSALKYSMS
ncbi:SRPBCC family protein [Kangiella shandongensis]|uniref:SRPBCC family protein n=1 Tax=Kangiella shandongensis TaxID=2763258 RepID=UPI001CBD025D|nr:SRPBCC family protein [Kangiella shandongensis]